MKNKNITFKIDANEIMLNRAGKVDGRMAEVRTGTGVWQDKRHKKDKHKKDFRREDW